MNEEVQRLACQIEAIIIRASQSLPLEDYIDLLEEIECGCEARRRAAEDDH